MEHRTHSCSVAPVVSAINAQPARTPKLVRVSGCIDVRAMVGYRDTLTETPSVTVYSGVSSLKLAGLAFAGPAAFFGGWADR